MWILLFIVTILGLSVFISPKYLGNFPWMAALKITMDGEKKWRCGGSIISKRHILTAAHCVHEQSTESMLVRVGDIDLNDDFDDGGSPKDVKIEKIMVHPNYSDVDLTRDIAVLTLEEDLKFNRNIQPICLPPPEGFSDIVEKQVEIAGWGFIDKYQTPTTHLRYMGIPVLSTSACTEKFNDEWNRVYSDEIVCAGFLQGGKDSCQGDSGGPLMLDHHGFIYSIGIESYGGGCAKKGMPNIYTKVSAYVDWIKTQTKSQFLQEAK